MQAKLIRLSNQQIQSHSYIFVIFVVAIFSAALIGIFTRPLAYSAFFWPANPIFLGLLLRFPQMRTGSALIGAFSGYMLADLMTGNGLALTFILTMTNFVAVLSTLCILVYIQTQFKYFKDGALIIYPYIFALVFGTLIGSIFAINTIPYVPDTFMSKNQLLVDFTNWWSGEFLNAVIVLPLVLAFPKLIEIKHFFTNKRTRSFNPFDSIPFIAVILSMIFTHSYYGPGALLYPLATLIWAASVYSLFNIAIINSFVCLTLYHSVSYLYLYDTTNSFLKEITSIRIGLAILGLATIILCIISQNRKLLFKEVYYLANHDTLTDTMNRRSFIRLSQQRLKNKKYKEACFLMLDIDFFKKLNDSYGHHAGDIVLKKFADIVKENLRSEDLFCRHGGEEFVVLLSNVDKEEAMMIAERIRVQLSETFIHIEQENPIKITVSMGVTHTQLPSNMELQQLINIADQALYRAKDNGRNCVVLA
ncbi:MAG: diguanylate cyclase [Acinetobacter sp.]|nr:diguanylate cyclase [Acinetobacter sp.]